MKVNIILDRWQNLWRINKETDIISIFYSFKDAKNAAITLSKNKCEIRINNPFYTIHFHIV